MSDAPLENLRSVRAKKRRSTGYGTHQSAPQTSDTPEDTRVVANPGAFVNTYRLVSLVALSASILRAQGSGTAASASADPSFRVSRYEELWPAAARTAPNLRALKPIALLPDGAAWLTIAGASRYRGIQYRNFQLTDRASMQDDYSELRTLLSADLRVGPSGGTYARLFAEGRDAQGFDRTLPGGVRTNEADRADWQNLLAEGGRGNSFVRYGRQELAVGRERLIGVADWANSRRSFEGWRATTASDVRLDLFDGRVVAIRSDAPDRPDSTTHLRLVSLSTVRDRPASYSARPALWQAYLIQLQTRNNLDDRTTVGARALWRAPYGKALLSLEAEGASQRGHIATRSVDAWFGVLEATTAWRTVRWAPSLLVGVDIGSGTGSDTLHHADNFQPPYATAHGFTGIADVFGRGNLLERRVGVGFEPIATVQVQTTLRRFSRVRLEDGVYTKTNTLLRAAGGSTALAVADEGDLTVVWPASKYLTVQGGVAFVLPSAFLRQTGVSAQERFAFISTAFTF